MPGSKTVVEAAGRRRGTVELSSARPGAWQAAESAWLAAQVSPHTRRHYHVSWRAFCAFIGADCDPRAITSDDVNAWIASLRARGQAATTIVTRVAACASLCDFVSRHAPDLLTDARGRLRSNPFRNEAVRRPRARAQVACPPLSDAAVQALLGCINADCLSGARDRALLLTALMTGWQTAALLSLRWAGRRDAGAGEAVELWQRGAAQEPASLPAAVADAIRGYLRLADRWPLSAGEFVWLPLRSDGVTNFRRARPDPARPISGSQANNILRRRLRLAGVADSQQYHLRDLRRTFARKDLAAGGDVSGLGRRLQHARPSVTQRFIAHLSQTVADDALLARWL